MTKLHERTKSVMDAQRDQLRLMAPCDSLLAEIRAERLRQIEVEGFRPSHDMRHQCGELAAAASCYCMSAAESLSGGDPADGRPGFDVAPRLWPFSSVWWKPKDYRRDLIRAAALILAELESYPEEGSGA